MGVYLYAICAVGVEPPTGLGPAGRGLRALESDGLTAVISDHPDRPPITTEENLWDHERVVEKLMSQHDLLPARFGTVLSSDDAVRELLHARGGELRAGLRTVAGAVELGIRAGWLVGLNGDANDPDGVRTGAAYLVRRAADHERAQRLTARVHAALGTLSIGSHLQTPSRPNTAMTGAYLVVRSQMDRFRERVGALNREFDDAQVVCTGPWPPYSFIEAGAAR